METLMERTEQMTSPIYGEIVPIAAIQQNITRVQAAKKAVMKKGLHYGVIPGTDKDTLFKPGAEVINLMFGVSVDPDPAAFELTEGRDDVGIMFFRCAVRMVLKTRSGIFLGASYGYASSLEEKYKWRRATGPKEFAATAEGRKRVKYRRRKDGEEWEELQVRTEDEDLRNTVIQIAMKRGEVSGTKRVHALSDMFGQDLEDMPPEILESIIDGEVISRDAADEGPQPGQRKSEQANGAAQPAQSGSPASTAATNGQPAAASTDSANIRTGKVAKVDAKQGPKKPYWFVVLDSGFKCATFKEAHAKTAEEYRQAEKAVRIEFKPSNDPEKYAPELVSIAVA